VPNLEQRHFSKRNTREFQRDFIFPPKESRIALQTGIFDRFNATLKAKIDP